MRFKLKKQFSWLMISCLVFVLLIAPITTLKAAGAALYFSPTFGEYKVSEVFALNVFVSSDVQAMNAASGVIAFPQDKLEVVSISRDGSIMSLWVQEPSYSNSTGIINFEGIVLNPGFTGSVGKIIKVNFKVKAVGSAMVFFNSGMILANDGRGTDILSSLGKANFNLTEAKKEKKIEIPKTTLPASSTKQGVPDAPIVSSLTHPDEDKWYNANTATFEWNLPAGVTGVNILADRKAESNPGIESDGLMDSYTYKNVEDGIWYFHIRLRNKYGWSKTTHFRFQVDTETPEPFEIEFIDGEETLNPRPTVLFSTVDAISGVDYYKIKIGEKEFENLPSDEIKKNPYTLPLQTPGRHIILVQAFDKAGNYSSISREFGVKALLTPVITDIPKDIRDGEVILIKGNTYAESEVSIWFQGTKGKPELHKVNSGSDGDFVFVLEDGLKEGVYQVWVEVMNKEGSISNPTDKYIIVVREPRLLKLGSDAVNVLSVFVPLVSLIILFGFIVWFSWQKFSSLKKRVRRQVGEAQYNLGQAYDAFRQDIRMDIEFLEKIKKKRKLTKEEQRIEENLKSNLDKIGKLLVSEMKGIKRELD